jgi:hypothetical protein
MSVAHRHGAEYTVRAPLAECFTDSKGFYRMGGQYVPVPGASAHHSKKKAGLRPAFVVEPLSQTKLCSAKLQLTSELRNASTHFGRSLR